MASFKKYQHLERLGTSEVRGIELGVCYIFPKIDGTNSSVWMSDDGELRAGSRKRELSLEDDNAGFYAWAKGQPNLLEFLKSNVGVRLYGEWLVPHSLKTYRKDTWRKFYVFDACVDIEQVEEGPTQRYLPYEEYQEALEKYNIDYIPPLCCIDFPSDVQLTRLLETNKYLIEDGEGCGEGVVVKRYDFVNKYGRPAFAKVVSNSFKDENRKSFGDRVSKGPKAVEKDIVEQFVTKELCEKVYHKLDNELGFTSKMIPRLLNTVYYDLIREESWEFIKKYKNPTIDFKKLQLLTFDITKQHLNKIF